MIPVIVLAVAFIPMAFEARLAARHDSALRAGGAFEPPGDVYGWMRVAYPAAFLMMAFEAAVRASELNQVFVVGVAVFVLAKAIKYWAISTLGSRWSFRVLVPPGSSLIRTGPYRFMRHPNYVGVIGELVGVALIARAVITGPLSVIVFGILIAFRIRVEERALDV